MLVRTFTNHYISVTNYDQERIVTFKWPFLGIAHITIGFFGHGSFSSKYFFHYHHFCCHFFWVELYPFHWMYVPKSLHFKKMTIFLPKNDCFWPPDCLINFECPKIFTLSLGLSLGSPEVPSFFWEQITLNANMHKVWTSVMFTNQGWC